MVRSPDGVKKTRQLANVGEQNSAVIRTERCDAAVARSHEAVSEMSPQRKSDNVDQAHRIGNPGWQGQGPAGRRRQFPKKLEVVPAAFEEQPGGQETEFPRHKPCGNG